jgi:hypothetical protein
MFVFVRLRVRIVSFFYVSTQSLVDLCTGDSVVRSERLPLSPLYDAPATERTTV